MARDRVLSLRLDDAEYERIVERAGQAKLSDVVRQMLLDHLAEAPACGAIMPGNWNGSYMPGCALPAPHPVLHHWWRHGPTGNVQMWSDDGTYSRFVAGAGWTAVAEPQIPDGLRVTAYPLLRAQWEADLRSSVVGNVPESVFRTAAAAVDPVDPGDTLRNPSFRAAVEVGWIHGRASRGVAADGAETEFIGGAA